MTQPVTAAPALRRPDGWQTGLAAFALAAALALLAGGLGWRGSDFPAQVFRFDLVREHGFVIWNSQWFGGHATLAYSVISPVLGAITGPVVLGAISGIAAAVLFARCAYFGFARASTLGALWFAVGTVTNLIVGRVTFALGVALGLAAIYALQRRHPVATVACALLCALASPLAGAFLAIALTAYAFAQREVRVTAAIALVATLLPIATLALLFPTPGAQPYRLWALGWDLICCGLVAGFAGRYTVLKWGALFYAIAALGSYIYPTALGGNVSRLGQYFAMPILACLLVNRGRVLLAILAIPMLMWQWVPTFDGIVWANSDPSTHAAYYTQILNFLETQQGPIGRVEIPFTYRHWETAYVGDHVLLARGWERQLDIAYNPIFYGAKFTPDIYRAWLADNGVKYVALPDVQLDDSSRTEGNFLRKGAPWLPEVWHNAHWKIFAVDGFRGLVGGGASVQSITPDKITLSVQQPGDLEVRVRASGHWAVSGGGCAATAPGGWTELRNVPAGTVQMSLELSGTPCSS
jgi:hypothetical protein